LPLLHDWLQRPHVHEWWNEHSTLDEVADHYGPSIDGGDPTDHYVVLLDERPIGFVETYLIADHSEWELTIGAEPGAVGVDLFIAEPELTGKGLGTQLLQQFVGEVALARPGATHCLADPDVANAASLRAFEKAGFRVVREFVDPEDNCRHAVVRFDPS
jgi:RimJ/RimL family protein N-acetyltransferase